MHGFRWHVWGMIDSRVFSFQKKIPHFRVQLLLTLLSQPPFIALGSLQCTIERLEKQVQMGTCSKKLNLNIRVLGPHRNGPSRPRKCPKPYTHVIEPPSATASS